MKLIHLSDLHLGKRVNDISMIEDQKYILAQILEIVDTEKPHAVLIAGDVYDKSVPSAEAVELLDAFLFALAQRQLQPHRTAGKCRLRRTIYLCIQSQWRDQDRNQAQ